MGECLRGTQEVVGSSPIFSTTTKPIVPMCARLFIFTLNHENILVGGKLGETIAPLVFASLAISSRELWGLRFWSVDLNCSLSFLLIISAFTFFNKPFFLCVFIGNSFYIAFNPNICYNGYVNINLRGCDDDGVITKVFHDNLSKLMSVITTFWICYWESLMWLLFLYKKTARIRQSSRNFCNDR